MRLDDAAVIGQAAPAVPSRPVVPVLALAQTTIVIWEEV
jgi:hypothetical protein